MDDEDRARFIHDLFEFNDQQPVLNVGYHLTRHRQQSIEIPFQYVGIDRTPRKLLVELLCFCLMPNHFHLMVRQITDGGITQFMRKLGVGYTNYFNEKYKRVGPLFQGTYKFTVIKSSAHFIHLPHYIHLNPLDLTMPSWREKELKDYKRALSFLEKYRWSSHLDYIGIKNFPSVTQREFLLEFFDGSVGYKNDIKKWLQEISLEPLKNITLEPIEMEFQ